MPSSRRRGSLLLSGAQVTPDGRARYGAPIPFPLFVVPDWLSIGFGAVSIVLVLPAVLACTARTSNRLLGMFRFTLGALVANGFFSPSFPSSDGLIPLPADPTLFLGAHIIGAGLDILCALVIIARLLLLNPEYKRLRKNGELSLEEL